MSNSSPSEVGPPDLSAVQAKPQARSFAFTQGDDSEFSAWERRKATLSASNPALLRLSQEDAITSEDTSSSAAATTTQTSSSSAHISRGSIPGEQHHAPGVASQTVPLHSLQATREEAGSSPDDSDDIDEL